MAPAVRVQGATALRAAMALPFMAVRFTMPAHSISIPANSSLIAQPVETAETAARVAAVVTRVVMAPAEAVAQRHSAAQYMISAPPPLSTPPSTANPVKGATGGRGELPGPGRS